jgi:DNA-binding MarR family transcriptional regulator
MGLYSRLWAWFYNYPDFDVSDLETAAIRAIGKGCSRSADLQSALELDTPQFSAVLDGLREKGLLRRHRGLRIRVALSYGRRGSL